MEDPVRSESDDLSTTHMDPICWRFRLGGLSAGHSDQRRLHRGTMGTHDGGSQ